MRAVVDPAALRGSDLACHALDAATQTGPFGGGDVESIAEFLTTSYRP